MLAIFSNFLHSSLILFVKLHTWQFCNIITPVIILLMNHKFTSVVVHLCLDTNDWDKLSMSPQIETLYS